MSDLIGEVKLEKTYDANYYNTSDSSWYYNTTLSVTINTKKVTENLDSSSGAVIENIPRSKSSYYKGTETMIVDLLSVSHELTFDAFVQDDSTFTTVTLDSISGTTITVSGDSVDSLPSSRGVILINDEIIYYASRSSGTLSGCRRGYAHTEEPSTEHSVGDTVYDITNSAIAKKLAIEQLRTRGGTINVYWRIFKYEALIQKVEFNDEYVNRAPKEMNTDYEKKLPNKFTFTITLRIGSQK